MTGRLARKLLFIIGALALAAHMPAAGAAETTSGCSLAPSISESQYSNVVIRPATDTANQQARWQRMGRNVEITVEDEAATPKVNVRVCFAWKLVKSDEEEFVPAVISIVEPLTGSKKGLKITAVVPELKGSISRFAKSGSKVGVYAENGTFALADVRVFYSVVKDGQTAEVVKPAIFGVIYGNVFCDYPYPSTMAGSGSLTVSDRKNWQPVNGEIEFAVKVASEKRIPPEALVKVCLRWKLAEGDNPGPFIDSNSTHIISATPDTLKVGATVPDLPNQPPRFAEKDATQSSGYIRGQYAIWRTAVPLADIRVILFGIDGFPIADVVSSIGITSFLFALLAVAVVLAAAYMALRLAWRTRLEGLSNVGPILCLITNRNGTASLSQFQIMLWTFVVLASAVYVISLSGELIVITTGTLVLLGISGASGVVSKVKSENDAAAAPPRLTPAAAAAAVEKAKVLAADALRALQGAAGGDNEAEARAALAEAEAKAVAAQSAADAAEAQAKAAKARIDILTATDKVTAETTAKSLEDDAAKKIQKAAADAAKADAVTRARHPRWSDLVMEESLGREIDVARVQMLFFTVITAVFVLLRVATSFVIPEIPEGFLILMGISNSVYVGSKFATNPAAK